ncbi:MAG TPA: hypothetical protein PLN33_17095 [Hyphomonadaceae bacterium]|nr:hypothetical protein [Hyphomonadaceae bacterium]HPN04371.1 hypothetical protein [Hyphomonadaceae bacterium]
MGTTIDHLESHHRYRVIRGFTDATGIRIPFEATAVIRRMELDPGLTQIFIEWEREGANGEITPERLTFDMRATDGPRNNHMREYFEKGEVVLPPHEPKAAKPGLADTAKLDQARSDQTRSDQAKSDPTSKQDHSQTVNCSCGPAFHRSLWPIARNISVNACLRCGTLAVTKQIGDDGRHTGDAWTAYMPVETPKAVLDWLNHFPRVAIHYPGAPNRWPMAAELVRYPMLFYPADARSRDEASLAKLEATLDAAQSPLTRANRQFSACGDIPRPPADLPAVFADFHTVQAALDLRTASDISTLRNHAHLRSASTEMAASILLDRANAYDLMMDWLSSRDDDAFSAGIAMLRDSRPLFTGPDDPKLTLELIAILNDLPTGKLQDVPERIESFYHFEALLVAIADLDANCIKMQDNLRALRMKLAKKDPTLVAAIATVLDELNTQH